MKLFKINMMSLLIASVFFTCAFADDTGWKKIGESEGITGYTKPTSRSSVEQIKGIGIVDAPVAVVEALIRDVPAATEYMYKCKESSVINTTDLKSSKDTVYFFNVTSMPYPVSDRDVIARADYSIDKASGAIHIHAEGITSDYKTDKSRIRTPLLVADYILIPKGPDKTEVTYMVLADPGGNIPSFAVNLMTKNMGIQTIAGMREMVKKDKYRNTRTVVTTTPH